MCVGGGVMIVCEFLCVGLIDDLYVGIILILIGSGIWLWDDFCGLEFGYCVIFEVVEFGVVYVMFLCEG